MTDWTERWREAVVREGGAVAASGARRGMFETAVRAAGIGVFTVDTRSGDCWYSDQFRARLGLEPGSREFLRDLGPLIAFTHPDDQTGLLRELEGHLDGMWPLDTEVRLQTGRGDVRQFRVTGLVDGVGERLVGSIEDVTARTGAGPQAPVAPMSTAPNNSPAAPEYEEFDARKIVEGAAKAASGLQVRILGTATVRGDESALRNVLGRVFALAHGKCSARAHLRRDALTLSVEVEIRAEAEDVADAELCDLAALGASLNPAGGSTVLRISAELIEAHISLPVAAETAAGPRGRAA